VVAEMRLVEPTAVVAHEVAHSTPVAVRGRTEEGKRPVQDRVPGLLPFATRKLERHNDETCDVVDAVAGFAVWDHAVGVLHDAGVIGKCQ